MDFDSFKRCEFVQFFNIIWHLFVQSDSNIYHVFPEKDCIPQLYI
jgi:hypothetical protein